MKITPNTYRPTLPERSLQNQTAASTAHSQKTSSSSVALSSTARHLQQAQATDQDINTTRVEALRQAIANGTMDINTNRIADGLIASTRDLLR